MDPNYDPHYDPIVSLPEVKTETGEENMEVLYKVRTKLFRLDRSNPEAPEWKERGVGDLKFLKGANAPKIRLLMRREKTLKICMNHFVEEYMELRENRGSDRSWVYQAQDFADEELKEEIFAIRFQNPEAAQEFKRWFERAASGEFKPAETDAPAAETPAAETTTEASQAPPTTETSEAAAAPAETPAAEAAPTEDKPAESSE
eukprot:gnl/Trimastix_PCT/320.p1 GENE.gnl/Trimastix_PCT/320~~gnl/Trimastix_PCT/320.p1  ORF type:complete len:230 (+),score=71.51 gnl/Trimastix_PCT/320:83-691(+)